MMRSHPLLKPVSVNFPCERAADQGASLSLMSASARFIPLSLKVVPWYKCHCFITWPWGSCISPASGFYGTWRSSCKSGQYEACMSWNWNHVRIFSLFFSTFSDERQFERSLPPNFKAKIPNLILCPRSEYLLQLRKCVWCLWPLSQRVLDAHDSVRFFKCWTQWHMYIWSVPWPCCMWSFIDYDCTSNGDSSSSSLPSASASPAEVLNGDVGLI